MIMGGSGSPETRVCVCLDDEKSGTLTTFVPVFLEYTPPHYMRPGPAEYNRSMQGYPHYVYTYTRRV